MMDAGGPVCYVAPADGGEPGDLQNPILISWYICPSQILRYWIISCIGPSRMKRTILTVRPREGIFMRRLSFLFYLVLLKKYIVPLIYLFFFLTKPYWTNSDGLVTWFARGSFCQNIWTKRQKRTHHSLSLKPLLYPPKKCSNASNNAPHARLMISKRVAGGIKSGLTQAWRITALQATSEWKNTRTHARTQTNTEMMLCRLHLKGWDVLQRQLHEGGK